MTKKKKILIVEDRPEIRKLVLMALNHAPYELHEAANGETGLTLAQTLRPDLVLLDVMMPGKLDGFAVCRAIKNDPQLAGIRVIMVTALAQESDLAQGRAAGADDYLVKPFTIFGLQATIRKYLDA